MNNRAASVVKVAWPPVALGLLLLGAWQAVVRVFDVKPYFLVAPTDVWSKFTDNWSNIWDAMQVTGTNAALGIVFGTIAGVSVSFVVSRFRLIDEFTTPMSIALNAIPAFVLVAVFNNIFSLTSVAPRRLMVTIVVFFVVLVNVSKGLRQVAPVHAELMRSYAASGWTILRKVRVPNAMPYLFTALRIAAPLSVIYAYVSEYFGGSQDGLGYSITSNLATAKNAAGWAYVGGACLLGLGFYAIAIVLERIAGRHAGAHRNQAGA